MIIYKVTLKKGIIKSKKKIFYVYSFEDFIEIVDFAISRKYTIENIEERKAWKEQ